MKLPLILLILLPILTGCRDPQSTVKETKQKDIDQAVAAANAQQASAEVRFAANREIIAKMVADQSKRIITKADRDAEEKVRKEEFEELRRQIKKNRADWLKWREANPDVEIAPNQIQTFEGGKPSIMRMVPTGDGAVDSGGIPVVQPPKPTPTP